MGLADPKMRCTLGLHLFDVRKSRLGVRCRCGLRKQDFEYLQGYNLTVRVKIKTKTDFREVR